MNHHESSLSFHKAWAGGDKASKRYATLKPSPFPHPARGRRKRPAAASKSIRAWLQMPFFGHWRQRLGSFHEDLIIAVKTMFYCRGLQQAGPEGGDAGDVGGDVGYATGGKNKGSTDCADDAYSGGGDNAVVLCAGRHGKIAVRLALVEDDPSANDDGISLVRTTDLAESRPRGRDRIQSRIAPKFRKALRGIDVRRILTAKEYRRHALARRALMEEDGVSSSTVVVRIPNVWLVCNHPPQCLC
ncbi:unnamed protein product [Symbiodinium sp. CCMP2456]|nr:unnamed protein product [Symbiodinium sp. CCMP2456]